MSGRGLVATGVAAVLFALVPACNARPSGGGGGGGNAGPVIATPLCAELLADATPADLRRGAEIWEALCTGCHGERGQGGASGDIHTADLTDPRRWSMVTDADRLRAIAEGVEGSPMLGWNVVLVESEISAVYRHLCALVGEAPGSP